MDNIKILQNLVKSAQQMAPPPKESLKISAAAQEFVEKLSNSTTDVILEFLQTKTKPVHLRSAENKLYRLDNLLLYRSNGSTAYKLEENLKSFEHTGLTPNFVKYFQLGKDDFLTVMDVDTKTIVPYVKVADKVPQQTKQKFENAVRSLYSGSFINREIFANKDALFVTPNGQKIFCADWGDVQYLSSSDKNGFADAMKRWHV